MITSTGSFENPRIWFGLVGLTPKNGCTAPTEHHQNILHLLYRNYIEQKQNISICSIQINIMIVSNRKYLPDNIYFPYYAQTTYIAYTHQSPFRPWHVDTSLTSPSCFSHDLSLPPPCRSCHSIEQWFGRRSIRNILASRTFSIEAVRFGFTRMSAGRCLLKPQETPKEREKIVSL